MEPNTTTPSLAESLLAAEKLTLEMLANGASLSEVLDDLCTAIDAHARPVNSMVCLLDGEWLSPCAGPHVLPHLEPVCGFGKGPPRDGLAAMVALSKLI
jgi:hypothetical protein